MPLMLRRTVEYTITASSTFGSQYSEDQLVYGDIPAAGKEGYWRPSSSDNNPYVEVCVIYVHLRMIAC